MIDALGGMLGKSVEVDGCHVGAVYAIGVEENPYGGMPRLRLEIVVPEHCMDNLREYAYINSVMGDGGKTV